MDASTEPSGLFGNSPREPNIGVHIRHARLRNGQTLKQVAKAVGCSESFISKVEHNRVRPSLSMLHRLVRVLNLNVAALFGDDKFTVDPVVIVRPEDRHMIRTGEARKGPGLSLQSLLPWARAKLLEANIHVIEPGGSSGGVIQHEGEDFGYVLEGSFELHVADKTYSLVEHSSFFFPSNLPHGYRNLGSATARVIWINTPPTF